MVTIPIRTFTREFLWKPKMFFKTGHNKPTMKWLVWAYIETVNVGFGQPYYRRWSSKEMYLSYYDISTNTSSHKKYLRDIDAEDYNGIVIW